MASICSKNAMSPWGPSSAAQISRFSAIRANRSPTSGKICAWCRVDGVCLHGRLNAFQQFCLDGSQHLVNVGVVQVKGGTVHVGVGDQLFYGDVAGVFLLHQLGQALAQQGTGTQDAAVGFGCRHRGKVLS